MQWVLLEKEQLEWRPVPPADASPSDGWVRLTVDCCGVCRTDAKMWREGHRDLVPPRVPGHEVAVRDGAGNAYVVWPGIACGVCRHCRAGWEHRCLDMRIMGFHFDGGFSSTLTAPAANLIPIPANVPSPLACLAEPLGCAINALEKLDLEAGERLLIIGGGTLGVMTAMATASMGASPLVVEKKQSKREKAAPLLRQTDTACPAATPSETYSAAINACPDPAALGQALALLAPGGRCAFFSGLAPAPTLANRDLNAVHYKELTLIGAYGLTRRHMTAALALIAADPAAWQPLVEAVVAPEKLPELLPRVLAGDGLRYILDFGVCRNR